MNVQKTTHFHYEAIFPPTKIFLKYSSYIVILLKTSFWLTNTNITSLSKAKII